MSCWHCDRSGCPGSRFGECPLFKQKQLDAEKLRAEVEASENWYIEELERLRERAPA